MKSFLALVFIFGAVVLPAQAQAYLHPAFVTPDGEKKVGQYIWVWHSETISKSSGREIEADCPLNYAVVGGGYTETKAFAVGATRPNQAFDGWVVDAFAAYSGSNTVTVFAGCAPAK